MAERKELFRPEAVLHRRQRARDSVLLYQHSFLGLITWSSTVLLCALVFLLCTLRYKESVSAGGVLEPRSGAHKVVAPVAAIVQQLRVEAGQLVRKGEVLAALSTSTFDASGQSASAGELRNLELERARLREEQDLSERQHDQALARNARQIAEQELALALAQEELLIFQSQLGLSEKTLDSVASLLAGAGVSRARYDQQQMAHLDLSRQYQAARQRRQQRRQDLEDARLLRQQLEIERRLALSRLEGRRLALDSRYEQLRSRDSITVVAAEDGVVAALAVASGDAVAAGQPLVYLNPDRYRLQAVLYVPSRVVGKLYPGQSLLLSYDAFNHLFFGRYPATVVEISQASFDPREHLLPVAGIDEPVFRVIAYPQQEYVEGPDIYRLQSGFALTADFVEADMSLIGFILKPLLQLRGKVS